MRRSVLFFVSSILFLIHANGQSNMKGMLHVSVGLSYGYTGSNLDLTQEGFPFLNQGTKTKSLFLSRPVNASYGLSRWMSVGINYTPTAWEYSKSVKGEFTTFGGNIHFYLFNDSKYSVEYSIHPSIDFHEEFPILTENNEYYMTLRGQSIRNKILGTIYFYEGAGIYFGVGHNIRQTGIKQLDYLYYDSEVVNNIDSFIFDEEKIVTQGFFIEAGVCLRLDLFDNDKV